MHLSINYCFANFKNFTNAQIDVSKPLTVLIGKNGSGKTNIIEGIEVLSHLAKGTPLHKFGDVGKSGDCEVRGGLGGCVGFGAADFELRFDVKVNSEDHPIGLAHHYRIKISKTAQHESILSEERLLGAGLIGKKDGSINYFYAQRQEDMLKVEYDDSAGGNLSISLAADCSVISRYEEIIATSTATNSQRWFATNAVKGTISYLKKVHIFDSNPKAMRGYEQIVAHAELSRDGGNLSAVLYALKKNKKSEELESITKIAGQLLEEPLLEIGFIETDANDVMLGFYVDDGKENKRLIDARVLSDNTLYLLTVLTALETVPEYSRVIIEKFDNGLYPSRASLLVEHLHKTAERRKLNLLVTTYNPAFMNALNEEHMKSVVLCHRDPKTGRSKLTSLMDIEDVDLMMLRGSLGNLVTGEIVEKHLSSEFRDKREEIVQELIKRYNL